jgi:hypothetical protein
MSIIFGSYSQSKSQHRVISGSGYENIAHVLDGVWRNLDEESGEEHDLVLACLAIPDRRERKKPNSWRRLLGIQESGFGFINTDWLVDQIASIGFDGFLVHTEELLDHYRVFGKPVWRFNPAYCFKTAREHSTGVKEKNRVCVNLVRYGQPEGNITGTLRVMQELPDYQFHSYTDQTDLLSSIKKSFGVNNWTIHKQVSWFDYLAEASKCQVHLSMDNRMTWGRFQLDAAACGSVCVGCHSEVQKMIFPDAMISQADTDMAVALIKHYSETQCVVDDRILAQFSHEQLRSRILEIANSL